MTQPERVLLIEDNFAQRLLYTSRLKEIGFDVGALNSNEDVTFFAEENNFSIILLNSNIGVSKTKDICLKIKEKNNSIKTVAFSSIFNNFVVEKLVSKQIDGFLAPVINHNQLLFKLNRFMACYTKEIFVINEKNIITNTIQMLLKSRGFSVRTIESKKDFENIINNTAPAIVLIDAANKNSLGSFVTKYLKNDEKFSSVAIIGIFDLDKQDELSEFFDSYLNVIFPSCSISEFIIDKIEEIAFIEPQKNSVEAKIRFRENQNGILKTFQTCCQLLKTQKKEINEAQNSLVALLRDQKDSLKKHSEMLKKEFEKRREIEEQLFQAQKMEAIGLLTSGVAHDFNNILQVISGYTEILDLHFSDTDPEKETVKNILHASQQAMGLSRQLLAFSRKGEIKKLSINITEALQKIVSLSRRTLGPKILIDTSCFSDQVCIFADPVHFEQIFLNLFINARDAMPDGGSIQVKVKQISNQEINESFPDFKINPKISYVKFIVADTGSGIPEDKLNQIFNPFFTTKGKDKGTGLGLATVQSCIEKHEGCIKVESVLNKGTSFLFILPLSNQEQLAVQKATSSSKIISEKLTILLAEDEPLVRDFASNLLKKHGFTVITAKDGLEAVEIFTKNPEISMLIFDVLMPGKSGKQAADEIRKLRPDIPILFCTGFCDELLKNDYLKKTGSRLLPKPYRPSDLIKSITELWQTIS